MYIVQVHIFCVANICLFFPISFTKKEKLSLSCEAFEGKEFAMEIREKKNCKNNDGNFPIWFIFQSYHNSGDTFEILKLNEIRMCFHVDMLWTCDGNAYTNTQTLTAIKRKKSSVCKQSEPSSPIELCTWHT